MHESKICIVFVAKNIQYIQGNNHNQSRFATLDDQLAADNPARLIDAFVDKLDLQKLGFTLPKSAGAI